MATSSICLYNKYGHCKFGQRCRLQHVDNICDSINCDMHNCRSRHPRICTYFSQFGRCKFADYCSFLHVSKHDQECKIKTVKEKLLEFEKLICEKDTLIANLENRVKAVEEEHNNLKLELNSSFENMNKLIEKAIIATTDAMVATTMQSEKEKDTNNQLNVLAEQLSIIAGNMKTPLPLSIPIRPLSPMNSATRTALPHHMDLKTPNQSRNRCVPEKQLAP